MKNIQPSINPEIELDNVYVFPIHKALDEGATTYDATRRAWRIIEKNKNILPAFAVGLKDAISIGSFEISTWTTATGDTNRHEFVSPNHPNETRYAPLLNYSWQKILEKAQGFWRRGSYLIVEFNGQGKFRIKRGSTDKSWQSC